jgi:hypothetical protein
MKYMSVFITILLTWLAVILMSAAVSNAADLFKLYIAVVIFTVILFVIGFGGKSR